MCYEEMRLTRYGNGTSKMMTQQRRGAKVLVLGIIHEHCNVPSIKQKIALGAIAHMICLSWHKGRSIWYQDFVITIADICKRITP